MDKELKNIRSYCGHCNCMTNQMEVGFAESRPDTETFGEYVPDYYIQYRLLKCRGCDAISFLERTIDFEFNYDPETGQADITDYVYPPVIKNHRKLADINYLPMRLWAIYNETIRSFGANNLILTAAGLRTIIECICLELGVKGQNLEAKIDNLSKKYLSQVQVNRLHSARFLGNDSLHTIQQPRTEHLMLVLGIVEDILKDLFITPEIIKKNKDVIETQIDTIEAFLELLRKLSDKLKPGVVYTFDQMLGDSKRRIKDRKNNIASFESELINQIKGNKIDYLILDKIEGNRQYYKLKS